MNFRFHTLAHALRSSRQWMRSAGPFLRPRISPNVRKGCQSKFSTTSFLRQLAQAGKKASSSAERKYPSRLEIYNAGDMRSSFVSFWKATAIFQFGFVCVFIAPQFYQNKNEPNPNLRLLHTVGIIVCGALPMIAMSYLTAPFVRTVHLEIPEYARRSRDILIRFSKNLPDDTRIEFTTLRAFPFRRTTAVFLFELRALPPQQGRFANIELVKTDAWRKRQSEKSFGQRIFEILNEPRWKFYVKEGRNYTLRTGVPGVWENVAKAIQEQTAAKAGPAQNMEAKVAQSAKNVKATSDAGAGKSIRRQTARSR